MHQNLTKLPKAAVAELSPLVNKPNFPTHLIAACGKSKRAVEQLVVSLLPKPDVPDQIRTLPTQPEKITLPGESWSSNSLLSLPQPPISNELLKSSLDMGGGGGVHGGIQEPANLVLHTTSPLSHHDQLQPLSEECVKVSFTCSADFRKKLEQLKALLWHKYPEGRLEDILEKALDTLLQQVAPEFKFRPRRQSAKQIQPAHSRHIPKHIKDLVWKRDHGRCQFLGTDGQQCNAEHGTAQTFGTNHG